MKKEQVFIILSHKKNIRKGVRVGGRKPIDSDWEITETVEFVNRLSNKHITMSSSIANYLEKKLISGKSKGMDSYEQFDSYVRSKYPKQIAQLDAAYGAEQVVTPEVPSPDIVADDAGNAIWPRSTRWTITR